MSFRLICYRKQNKYWQQCQILRIIMRRQSWTHLEFSFNINHRNIPLLFVGSQWFTWMIQYDLTGSHVLKDLRRKSFSIGTHHNSQWTRCAGSSDSPTIQRHTRTLHSKGILNWQLAIQDVRMILKFLWEKFSKKFNVNDLNILVSDSNYLSIDLNLLCALFLCTCNFTYMW